jgi:hypothetical protein
MGQARRCDCERHHQSGLVVLALGGVNREQRLVCSDVTLLLSQWLMSGGLPLHQRPNTTIPHNPTHPFLIDQTPRVSIRTLPGSLYNFPSIQVGCLLGHLHEVRVGQRATSSGGRLDGYQSARSGLLIDSNGPPA